MVSNVYAIYDEKAEAYNTPFPLATDGLARRSFDAACKDPGTDLYRFPGDYSLYCVGKWNDQDGSLESIVPPRFIAKNVSAVQIAQQKFDEELSAVEAEVEKETK